MDSSFPGILVQRGRCGDEERETEGQKRKKDMRKKQMKQERKREEQQFKNTRAWAGAPEPAPLPHSFLQKKSRRADPGPSQGHCIIKRKGTFLPGGKPAVAFPSMRFSPATTSGQQPRHTPNWRSHPPQDPGPRGIGEREASDRKRWFQVSGPGRPCMRTPEPWRASC